MEAWFAMEEIYAKDGERERERGEVLDLGWVVLRERREKRTVKEKQNI